MSEATDDTPSLEEALPEPEGPSLLDIYDTDQDAETAGRWFQFGGAEIKLAASGQFNAEYVEMLTELMEPVGKALTAGKLPDARKIEDGILLEAFCHTVVKGMRGNIGFPYEDNPKGYMAVMKRLPRLFADCREIAGKGRSFKPDTTEVQGNA